MQGPFLVGARVPLVALLCFAAVAQAFTSLRTKSLTFDELTYIPAGYSYVVTGDLRLNPEHPPLTKLLAGAALLARGPELDLDHPSWQSGAQWDFGRRFFQLAGSETHDVVTLARLPTLALLAAMVLFAYLMGCEVYGPRAGMMAAWLCAFSPNLLAHGRLATTDFAQALFVLVTAWAFLRFVKLPGILRAIGVGVALGLALLTKYSAVLLVGLVGVWSVATVVTWRPADGPAGRPPNWWSTWAANRIVLVASGLALAFVAAALVVSLGYLTPGDPRAFVRNFGVLYSNVHLDLPTYFAGRFHEGGLWYYFLAAFVLKAPLALLVLIVIRAAEQSRRRALRLVEALYLILPAVVWVAVMSATALQFGVRYILPVYPLLFVWIAGIAESPTFHRTAGRVVLASLALLFAAASLRAHPHYLPFFNLAAGGPERGIEWLDDSNVDWGQDLPLLAAWLEERGIDDAVVVPMAQYDPGLYGVRGRVRGPEAVLPTLASRDPMPGVYAVSAHLLTRVRWGGAPAVDPLRDLEPAAVLGHTIWVFDLRDP